MGRQNRLFQLGPKPGVMATIRSAALAVQTVEIVYVDSSGQSSLREVEPYEFRGDKLWAFCLESNGIRQFTISKILDAKLTGRIFAPRWPIKIV